MEGKESSWVVEKVESGEMRRGKREASKGGCRGSWEMERVSGKANDAEKGECKEVGGELRWKRRKMVDEEEEEASELDWRYGEYLYDKWMWASMEERRFAFPDVSMWYWLFVLKERLWKRYNMFYEADAIGEVYPENEIAGWVWEACEAKMEPRVVWRDHEMSYEWTNDWCGRQAPKKIRSYEEEMDVQARRKKYREGVFAWNTGQGVEMPRRPRKINLSLEEEEHFLKEKERFWNRRRVPCEAQHKAGEPNHLRWDTLQEALRKQAEVS